MGRRRGGRKGRPISCTYCEFINGCPLDIFYADTKDCGRYNHLHDLRGKE